MARLKCFQWPIPLHQGIVIYLLILLKQYVASNSSGSGFFCAHCRSVSGKANTGTRMLPILGPGRIADPRQQPKGADLVIEVVSDEEEARRRIC